MQVTQFSQSTVEKKEKNLTEDSASWADTLLHTKTIRPKTQLKMNKKIRQGIDKYSEQLLNLFLHYKWVHKKLYLRNKSKCS